MALGTPGDPAVTMTTRTMTAIVLVVVTESRVRVTTRTMSTIVLVLTNPAITLGIF